MEVQAILRYVRYSPLKMRKISKVIKENYSYSVSDAINVLKLNSINGLPTRNFSQGFFENAKNGSGENFAETCLTQQISCAHCQVGCIHLGTVREAFKIEEHMYKTFKVSYDHETIFSMGTNLSIEDPETILKLLIFIEKQNCTRNGGAVK